MKLEIPDTIRKLHMERVADIGCIVEGCQAPAEVHHIRALMEKNDMNTVPLCRAHHTGEFSAHMTPRAFHKICGTELELLAKTNAVLLKISLNNI